MIRKEVTFSAEFKTTVLIAETPEEVEAGGYENEDDAIADIDVPETDTTRYVGDSFEVEKIKTLKG